MKGFDWLSSLRQRWPKRWLPSENTILLTLAVSVGLATAVGVWLFRQGFDFFQRVFREGLVDGPGHILGPWAIVPVLALGGLIVGLAMDRLIGEERHHGVAGIMEAVALAGGRLRYQRMPIKALLASFSIGAGASVGPEDPSVQIGANLGSMFGQWLHLSDERVKLLVAAGAAGGIASAFNAPIAGVFFALETVLGDFSTSSFGVVVLAAVIASIVTQAIEANGPELGIRSYALGGVQELPLYIIVGLLAAPIGALFIRVLYWQHDFWHHLPLPRPVKTLLAGAVVGLIAVFLPQIMGTGQVPINALLNENRGEFSIMLLLALVFAKLIATTVSLGGGFVGGMFAPSMFVGAALGGAFGRIMQAASGGSISANPAAFAMAGMAAMLTAVIRAPITGVLLLFELTNDYKLILPIMLVTAVCLFVIERLAPDGLYQMGLARKGVRLARGRDIDLMQSITVGAAMDKDIETVNASLPAKQLSGEFARTNPPGLIVVDDEGLLYGIVTPQDLTKNLGQLDGKTTGDICTREVLTVFPGDLLSKALQLIASRDLGRLPVVDPNEPRKIVGVLRRRDIARAYDLAVHQKMEGLYRGDQVRLATYSRAYITEIRVDANSPADHHLLRELSWPKSSLVASIFRHGQVIPARGDTQLEAGDVLTVVTTPGKEDEIARIVSVKDKSGQH